MLATRAAQMAAGAARRGRISGGAIAAICRAVGLPLGLGLLLLLRSLAHAAGAVDELLPRILRGIWLRRDRDAEELAQRLPALAGLVDQEALRCDGRLHRFGMLAEVIGHEGAVGHVPAHRPHEAVEERVAQLLA